MKTDKNECLSDADFMIGTLTAATETDPTLLLQRGDRRIDAAFHAAYQHLVDQIEAGETGVDPQFSVYPDRLHGNSETVLNGMSFLHSLGYLARLGYSGYYRFSRRFDRAPDDVFEQIPAGSPQLFRGLGEVFLETLRSDKQLTQG